MVTMLNLFSREYDTSVLRANWEYYEPRTEHGSSLSAGMYAMLACKIGEPQRALSLFYEIGNGRFNRGRQRVGRSCIYWWDTSAAAGAAYMTVVEGFAGICTENGRLVCHPHLPQSMEELEFSVIYQNREYRVHIDQKEGTITAL